MTDNIYRLIEEFKEYTSKRGTMTPEEWINHETTTDAYGNVIELRRTTYGEKIYFLQAIEEFYNESNR